MAIRQFPDASIQTLIFMLTRNAPSCARSYTIQLKIESDIYQNTHMFKTKSTIKTLDTLKTSDLEVSEKSNPPKTEHLYVYLQN